MSSPSQTLQHGFPRNKAIFLYNHNAVSQAGKFNIDTMLLSHIQPTLTCCHLSHYFRFGVAFIFNCLLLRGGGGGGVLRPSSHWAGCWGPWPSAPAAWFLAAGPPPEHVQPVSCQRAPGNTVFCCMVVNVKVTSHTVELFDSMDIYYEDMFSFSET